MVRTASMFSQLLNIFPRIEFEKAVREHKAERYGKGFTCWEQFVAMLFCQLAQAHSLREICGGLRDQGGGATRETGQRPPGRRPAAKDQPGAACTRRSGHV